MYLPKRDGNTTEEFVHKYSSVLLILVKNKKQPRYL